MRATASRILLFAAAFGILVFSAAAQTQPQPKTSAPSAAPSPADQQLLNKVESYLRMLFGWGPEYKMQLGPVMPSPIPDLEKVSVSVVFQGKKQTGTVYVTKNGRFMFRGEIRDMTKNPFADNLSKITTADSPYVGPANAKVTVVEFSDFECPHCQEMYTILQQVIPEFPQVRFVYKNFPLQEIHPWAMTAALTGRCVYKTAPSAFEKYQAEVFGNQDVVTPDNAWDQLTAYAVAASGGTATALHACMTDPATKSAVQADVNEGKSLGVESTPTFFVNGRAFVGGDRTSLEQVIRFALHRVSGSASSPREPHSSRR